MHLVFETALVKCNENLYFLKKLQQKTYCMHYKTAEYHSKSFFGMVIFVQAKWR